MLTGLSTEAFDKAAVACTMAYDMFSAQFPPESTFPCQTTVYEGHPAIDFNARYFTKRSDAPNEGNLPFEGGVDPDGILEKLRGQDLIHGPDNRVQYLTLLDDDRYVFSPPSHSRRLNDMIGTQQ